MVSKPYQNYIKQEVEGATKGKLVLLLYDGAIKFMRQACVHIEDEEVASAHNSIMRAQNIIYELMSTLNMDAGEVSQNLLRLYDFVIWQLIEANRDKSVEKLTPVIDLLTSLREAWKDVVGKEEGTLDNSKETDAKSINFAG